jgi:NADPH:quinone reductase-like Zn-dependent oxidoreductase
MTTTSVSLPDAHRIITACLPKGPDSLTYGTAPLPVPKANEVLVRVHAAGIIWGELTWDALFYDPITKEPRSFIPGIDFSGIVVSMGADVPADCGIKVDDDVYGCNTNLDKYGSFAQYTVTTFEQLALKPKNLSMEQADGMPLSALTAWQALFDHADLQKGQKILITGAAGGTGIFACPLAKWKGAYVIGTAGAERSFEILHGFGVDEIVDYKKPGWEERVGQVDCVLDCVGGETLEKCWGLVKKGGWLCSITVNPWSCQEQEQKGRELGVRTSFFIFKGDGKQQGAMAELVEKGKLRVIVEEVFPFEKAKEAFLKGEQGAHAWKAGVEVFGIGGRERRLKEFCAVDLVPSLLRKYHFNNSNNSPLSPFPLLITYEELLR